MKLRIETEDFVKRGVGMRVCLCMQALKRFRRVEQGGGQHDL